MALGLLGALHPPPKRRTAIRAGWGDLLAAALVLAVPPPLPADGAASRRPSTSPRSLPPPLQLFTSDPSVPVSTGAPPAPAGGYAPPPGAGEPGLAVLPGGFGSGAAPNTLDEPIWATVKRDLLRIYKNLVMVVFPFKDRSQQSAALRNWDLWGPMIFVLGLAISLSIGAATASKTFSVGGAGAAGLRVALQAGHAVTVLALACVWLAAAV